MEISLSKACFFDQMRLFFIVYGGGQESLASNINAVHSSLLHKIASKNIRVYEFFHYFQYMSIYIYVCICYWGVCFISYNFHTMFTEAQHAVECIFCSACIRFFKCCPQEGLTG